MDVQRLISVGGGSNPPWQKELSSPEIQQNTREFPLVLNRTHGLGYIRDPPHPGNGECFAHEPVEYTDLGFIVPLPCVGRTEVALAIGQRFCKGLKGLDLPTPRMVVSRRRISPIRWKYWGWTNMLLWSNWDDYPPKSASERRRGNVGSNPADSAGCRVSSRMM